MILFIPNLCNNFVLNEMVFQIYRISSTIWENYHNFPWYAMKFIDMAISTLFLFIFHWLFISVFDKIQKELPPLVDLHQN